jgi:hypothetical protein
MTIRAGAVLWRSPRSCQKAGLLETPFPGGTLTSRWRERRKRRRPTQVGKPPGHLRSGIAVADLTGSPAPELLIGGHSNAFGDPMLAVLPSSDLSGHALTQGGYGYWQHGAHRPRGVPALSKHVRSETPPRNLSDDLADSHRSHCEDFGSFGPGWAHGVRRRESTESDLHAGLQLGAPFGRDRRNVRLARRLAGPSGRSGSEAGRRSPAALRRADSVLDWHWLVYGADLYAGLSLTIESQQEEV